MENKGQIIATDIYDFKLAECKRRAKRAGAHNVETRFIDSPKVIKKLYGTADRVLIDAPCSGLGVLRRNPDSKWKLSPQFMEEIQELQADILARYSRMVKDGGKLVYATCSILPAENGLQVEKFLASEAGAAFKKEEERTLWPSETGYDGFYMCLLTKSN
jgi:16S rRNA (cytosine967-C5)-methyltransferase